MSVKSTAEPLPYRAQEVADVLGSTWPETMLSAYRWMALGRSFDRRMQGLQRQGRIGFYGAAMGQEAVNVATGLLARPDDWVFPGLREPLIAIVRGLPLTDYAHSVFGTALDAAHGRQMPCHPTARSVRHVSMSSVIGTQISQAVGLAYALRLRGDPGIAFAFFGDGATSSNDFHAGMNFAGVFGLPVVFCCANNQWAISVPVERQTHAATLATKAAAYGFDGLRVDGTDFVAVSRALRGAAQAAREGRGPTLLEFVTFRMTPHSSSDDPGRYQPADWGDRGARSDPVDRLERWVVEHGLLTEDERGRIWAEAEEKARAAVEAAEAAPPPPPETLTEDVYAPRGSARTP